MVCLDFQKAFDKVLHKRLILKLNAVGIQGNACTWIREWLTCRNQKVLIRGETSKWSEVTSGEPQGSVLGPLLFLIYINDLDSGIVSKLVKFADDTKIGGVANTVEAAKVIQNDLDSIGGCVVQWLKKRACNQEVPGSDPTSATDSLCDPEQVTSSPCAPSFG